MTTTEAFRNLTLAAAALTPDAKPAYILAELNDLLTAAQPEDFDLFPEPAISDPYRANYIAAMVELAAHRKGVFPPRWTSKIPPLSRPVFAVPLMSLRAHLLLESPVPFRRRNIFIDSSIGDRV